MNCSILLHHLSRKSGLGTVTASVVGRFAFFGKAIRLALRQAATSRREELELIVAKDEYTERDGVIAAKNTEVSLREHKIDETFIIGEPKKFRICFLLRSIL